MKVKIGPYKSWIGPYQIANALFLWPRDDLLSMGDHPGWRVRWAERLGDWLSRDSLGRDSKFTKFCHWLDSKRERQVYVHIDNYDVWNMDHTLSLIIGPMFVKLKQQKQGSGHVDDCDVPEHLRSTSAPPVANDWDLDDNFHLRYEWLLDEMVWAFTTDHEAARQGFYDHSQVDETAGLLEQVKSIKIDEQALVNYDKRLQRAYQLFGKYYQTFWD